VYISEANGTRATKKALDTKVVTKRSLAFRGPSTASEALKLIKVKTIKPSTATARRFGSTPAVAAPEVVKR
jgi:hypothetical protein